MTELQEGVNPHERIKVVQWDYWGGMCPTQAEAVGADGHVYYLRYRHGLLSVTDLGVDRDQWDRFFVRPVGDDPDGGYMTDLQMREAVSEVLDFSETTLCAGCEYEGEGEGYQSGCPNPRPRKQVKGCSWRQQKQEPEKEQPDADVSA